MTIPKLDLDVTTTGIRPTCRYEHGPLKRVVVQHPRRGSLVRFAWKSTSDPMLQFVGEMFSCPICGYIEVFDDMPRATHELSEKSAASLNESAANGSNIDALLDEFLGVSNGSD